MKVIAIAWKDAIIRFSSRSEILFFLILPIFFTYILGGGGASDGNGVAVPLLVVDQDRQPLSSTVINALRGTGAVEVQVVDLAAAKVRLAEEAVPAVLVIPAGFEATLFRGRPVVVDFRGLPDNRNSTAAEQAVHAALSTTSRSLLVAHNSLAEAERIAPFASESERATYFTGSLAAAQNQFQSLPNRVSVTRPAATGDSDDYDPAAQSSAGQLITWVFVPLLATSGLLAYERTKGTLRRLVTTPTSKATFLLGAISGQYGLAIVQMSLLVSFGVWVMGVNWGQSIPGLAAVLLTFGLASVAFGVMLGTFVKTEGQASNLSIAAGMTMALLGGCWWPAELFPEGIRTVVRILPTTWAMQALTDLLMAGKGLVDVLPVAAVLIGFAIVFFVIGIWRFRFE
jgi:ABC-2 type transport system permease protein